MNLSPKISLSSRKNSSSDVLVVFCKWPRLNHGKQRLAESIGASKAFQLASLLIDCTLEDAAEWDGEVVFAISDEADFEQVQTILKKGVTRNKNISLLIQPPGNLGQRINEIDSELRKQGKENLIFIGTDSPGLNQDYFQQVKITLNLSDVVLSNAYDGGVVIMANSKAWPNLTNLPWSTENLSKELSLLCINAGLNVKRIVSGYDVDIESDLDILLDNIQFDPRPSRKAVCEWVRDYFKFNQEIANQESSYVR